jgi:hypothetical protein
MRERSQNINPGLRQWLSFGRIQPPEPPSPVGYGGRSGEMADASAFAEGYGGFMPAEILRFDGN